MRLLWIPSVSYSLLSFLPFRLAGQVRDVTPAHRLLSNLPSPSLEEVESCVMNQKWRFLGICG